ncbi:MAG: FAD-dependent oxidoreductase, partial [Pseudomonadota bacterium]
AILDDEIHAAVVPRGGRVRFAGTAGFFGWSSREDPARVDNLWYILSEICPDLLAVSDRESAKSWCGLRPMSADGCPYIGETPIAGLYVNTGHGPLGWTQASGSAALLASLLRGKPGGVDADLFSPGR